MPLLHTNPRARVNHLHPTGSSPLPSSRRLSPIMSAMEVDKKPRFEVKKVRLSGRRWAVR